MHKRTVHGTAEVTEIERRMGEIGKCLLPIFQNNIKLNLVLLRVPVSKNIKNQKVIV